MLQKEVFVGESCKETLALGTASNWAVPPPVESPRRKEGRKREERDHYPPYTETQLSSNQRARGYQASTLLLLYSSFNGLRCPSGCKCDYHLIRVNVMLYKVPNEALLSGLSAERAYIAPRYVSCIHIVNREGEISSHS